MKFKYIIIFFICCLILTGCNNKEVTETSNISLESTDTKFVVQIADNQYYIFYYEKETVSDFEIWISMSDETLRNNLYNDYQILKENDNNIEEVKTVEDYVVINYKEEYIITEYNTNNIDEIKDYYINH